MQEENREDDKAAVSGRTSRRWYWMPTTSFLLGILSTILLIWINQISVRQYENSAFSDVIMDVQLKTATAHLWLEEVIAGSTLVDIKKVWADFDRSVALAEVLVSGGEYEHGTVLEPLKDPGLRAQAEAIRSLLIRFKMQALERFQEPEKAGIGTDADARFNVLFKEIADKANALDVMIQRDQSRGEVQSRRLFLSILFVWVSTVIVVGTVIWNRDLRRRRAEGALRASEARYRRLFEAAKDGIVILDADTGRIKEVNPSLKDLVGYSDEELRGKRIWEIGLFKDIEASKSAFRELQHHEYVRFDDLLLETRDGQRMDVEFVSNVYFVDHEKVVQCNIRDITRRKHAEQKLVQTLADLKRSNEELEQFAYVASHDLQEPLRKIASFTELLEKRYGDKLDPDAGRYINHIVDGAKRMHTLINDLLSYSRLGTSENFVQTDCNKILDRVLADMRKSLRDSGTTVTHDELPTLTGNEVLIGQVFQNLIGNAIKFRRDEPPSIHVSAKREGRAWVFSVSDNGIGIEPEFFDRIFVMFQRLHTRAEYPGTGIGLAICKKIIEGHGGTIWVESEPGKGSTFYFKIPEGFGG